MRFIADQDVYKITIDMLRQSGHNVVTARELGMSQSGDTDILLKTKELNRILISRDKDFGRIVFLHKDLMTGVIFLRMIPETSNEVHNEINKLFKEHSEEELKKCFCVVESNRHRIRKLK